MATTTAPLTYCLVPRHLADQLLEPLRRHFAPAGIAVIDKAGPRLNAVIELNPDAARIAADLDRERCAGKVRGPLHGIPILLKDNIATADRMSTSAGSDRDSRSASSRVVSRHDSGTKAMPDRAQAKNATTWSVELPDTVAMRSPGP